MHDRPACSLCQHSCDERWVGDGTRAFCARCLAAMGRFVWSGALRAHLWPALEEVAPEGEAGPAEGERHHVEELVGRDWQFREFENGLNGVFRPDAAETRLDLAIAYREMGLDGDALREAALALQHERGLTRRRALEALELVLDRRLLRFGVDETIVALREALFAN